MAVCSCQDHSLLPSFEARHPTRPVDVDCRSWRICCCGSRISTIMVIICGNHRPDQHCWDVISQLNFSQDMWWEKAIKRGMWSRCAISVVIYSECKSPSTTWDDLWMIVMTRCMCSWCASTLLLVAFRTKLLLVVGGQKLPAYERWQFFLRILVVLPAWLSYLQ